MKKLTTLLLTAALVVAMLVPASAASFTASVEAKTAPEASTGVITTADGEVVDVADAITVTPLASATGEVAELLASAQADIAAAATLNDLADISAYIPEGVSVEDLVVADLFDVSLTDEYAEILAAGGSVSISFATSTEVIAVLHKDSELGWEALPFEAADGVVTVTFTSLSPVAFVADGGVEVSYDVTSPETGAADNSALLLFAGALVLVAGACFVTASRKKA